MANLTRRRFLEDSMLAIAAASVGGASGPLWADEQRPSRSPSDRIGVAIVGVGGRGTSQIKEYVAQNDIEVLVVCDVDSEVGQKKAEELVNNGHRTRFVRDLREAFDDPSIDVVSIATPNHWHALAAIWAMQAGKDVYVEKPVSHNISEGQSLVAAARKYKRICQTGTQYRSADGTRQAMAYIHEGKLGEVNLARGLCYKTRRSIGPKGDYHAPSTVDYKMWCGPAPTGPITRQKFHYDWHWLWEYGNGDLGNQGIHQMDVARWGLKLDTLCNSVLSYGGRFGYDDAGETANTQVVIFDYGPKTLVFEVRGLETDTYMGAGVGVIFYGSEGYMVCPTYHSATVFSRSHEKLVTFEAGGDHIANFLNVVRSRKAEDLNADIHEGHLSSALCHLGNISYRLGERMSNVAASERLKSIKSTDNVQDTMARTIAHLAANKATLDNQMQFRVGPHLAFDPQAERFVRNNQADALLTRDYRAKFAVPSPKQV